MRRRSTTRHPAYGAVGPADRNFISEPTSDGRAVDFAGRAGTEPVAPALQIGTEDTLSAMAQLCGGWIAVDCDTSARTFDGRRLSEIDARTVGMETVAATRRSIFAGPALRCDFEGRMLAGFLLADNRAEMQRPLHGSAWFAAIEGSPPLPVRLQFETRWFGIVTMLLTAATIDPTMPGR